MLRDTGAIRVGDVAFPTFECPDCVIEKNQAGKGVQTPVLFSLDRARRVIDPLTQKPPDWLEPMGSEWRL